MISIEPTRDLDWMWSIALHPAIYDFIRGGTSPAKSAMAGVVADERNHFLAVEKDGVKVGFFAYHFVKPRVYELHICIVPEGRGLAAREAFTRSLQWMFNIGASLIVAIFDAARREVDLFCRWAGFKKVKPGFLVLERK